MSDTPIIDAALRKAIAPGGNIEDVCLRFLRAALPWEPSAATIEAIKRPIENTIGMYEDADDTALRAYHANPIMRELYPERFR
jgi:hypothetical protein